MSSPTLVLEFNNIDGKFHVNNRNGHAMGAAYEIPDAIAQARTVSNEPIDIGDSYAGFTEVCVPEKPDGAFVDTDMFIAALAEIAGMKVTRNYNDKMHFVGYTMEVIE